MERTRTSKRCGIAATAIFLAAAVVQFVRMLTSPAMGTTMNYGHIVTPLLALLWLAAAAAVYSGKPRGMIAAVLGTFAFLPTFVVTRAAGGWFSLVYLFALPILVPLVRFAFAESREREREREPTRPRSDRRRVFT